MSVELNIALDARNLAKFRRLFGASKLLAAQSLTFTAERAKPAWIAGNSLFHRRNAWIDKGVRMSAATPGNLNAQVGTKDRWMGRHVKGIEQPKVSGGKGLFVPNEAIADQPTHTKMRARLRAMFKTKSKPFWRNGVLLRRSGPGHGAPLIVLGRMMRSVKIEPRLDTIAIVDDVVQRTFPTVYERLLLKYASQL